MSKNNRASGKNKSISKFQCLFSNEAKAKELLNAVFNTDLAEKDEIRLCNISSNKPFLHNFLTLLANDRLFIVCDCKDVPSDDIVWSFISHYTETLFSLPELRDKLLYSRQLVKIPSPRFAILYHGKSPLEKHELRIDSPHMQASVKVVDNNRHRT